MMEIKDLSGKWYLNEEYGCWCLEDVPYTDVPGALPVQSLNIFVPKDYMSEGGVINADAAINGYTPETVPVIFENNSAGYMEMPNVKLGEGRCYAAPYLNQGYVYISCGNRGSGSVDADGVFCGKAPANLVDEKTAIRFLRHNRGAFPGNLDRIISVGWSAGGAMSTLIGVSGNNERFDEYLRANGAYMDESDSVFASQIYCPIVDLDHANLAYEWAFGKDPECMDSPAGPAEVMNEFKRALSEKLTAGYIKYFNSLELLSVEKKIPLRFNEDGRSGSAYDYIMFKLNESATEFLGKLSRGEAGEGYGVDEYLSGNYTYPVVKLQKLSQEEFEEAVARGEKLLRPMRRTMIDVQGDEKKGWLKWDGSKAEISGLDTYILNHYRRMKPCPSFDLLGNNSGENSVFGDKDRPFKHFDKDTLEDLKELEADFPEECRCISEFEKDLADEKLKEMIYLYNPLTYIGTEEKCDAAEHYRICVGSRDADTSLFISLALACRLGQYHSDVTHKIIWDRPHSEADYEGDVIRWIEGIVK